MKAVGHTNIKTLVKWAFPAGILAISVVSVIAIGAGTGGTKTAGRKAAPANAQSQPTVTKAPETSPAIMINGMEIPAPATGSRDISIPGGNAHIDVSGGSTHVSAHSSQQNGDAANTNTSSVNINIDTHTSSSNDGSRSSSDNTTIFSSGVSSVNGMR